MTNHLIHTLILLFFITVNFIVIKLIGINPEIISGFEWGNTKEEKEEATRWVALLRKSMNTANIITFIGSTISLVLESEILFFLFLFLPTTTIVIYAYYIKKRKRLSYKHKTVITVSSTCIVAILLLSIIYIKNIDLKIEYDEKEFKIRGPYTTNIVYQDIKQIKMTKKPPVVIRRSNGISLGDIKIGKFVTSNTPKAVFFIHSQGPCIEITINDGSSYYLNSKHSDITLENYCHIKSYITK